MKHPSCLLVVPGSNFIAGRKGSKVFGAVWEAQKAAPWPFNDPFGFWAYFICDHPPMAESQDLLAPPQQT